jgi:hypothetical protein
LWGVLQVDHHKSRVLKVPALAPFERRNVRHYSKHDGKGRPVTAEDAKARTIRVEDAAGPADRRIASVSGPPTSPPSHPQGARISEIRHGLSACGKISNVLR